ncbi:putative 5-methylcytosine-specific restriction enzyme B [Vibrio phage pVa-7]|nr:putative 5-methylcytosine-specific restriction enzyme B [Vibrio phage H2 PGK-2017]ARB12984.1 putative 5-methylcytosine-specific restriction enzyme B [Vibrio phage H8]ARB13149.1 putative 5-methylcytosine-specific restriction enzyme B [Vibrio phage P2]ARB13304.2 putative 5-methylcytosine-specific restriction enzyme B [Vibrio phage pVa-3]ARH11826.1 putative 5-methylcytosine-specific restriction enzyme B [Vibrio phage pVa-4]ARH11878.1 putative 5-methylcytosine-specific restriction enzyme B [Vib
MGVADQIVASRFSSIDLSNKADIGMLSVNACEFDHGILMVMI